MLECNYIIREFTCPIGFTRGERKKIMNSAAKLFCDYLDQKNIKYSEVDSEVIRITYTGENCPTIPVNFTFSDDGRNVSIQSFSISKINKEDGKQYLAALLTCSELNKKYRWVKFYLDDDCEITAEDDAVIDPYTTGEECFKLLGHMINIVDKAYPIIMKMIWGLGLE